MWHTLFVCKISVLHLIDWKWHVCTGFPCYSILNQKNRIRREKDQFRPESWHFRSILSIRISKFADNKSANNYGHLHVLKKFSRTETWSNIFQIVWNNIFKVRTITYFRSPSRLIVFRRKNEWTKRQSGNKNVSTKKMIATVLPCVSGIWTILNSFSGLVLGFSKSVYCPSCWIAASCPISLKITA